MYSEFKSSIKLIITVAGIAGFGVFASAMVFFKPFDTLWLNHVPMYIVGVFILLVVFSPEGRFIGHPELVSLEGIEDELRTMNRSKDDEIRMLRRMLIDRDSEPSRRSSSLRYF